jgi:hypothetical protein
MPSFIGLYQKSPHKTPKHSSHTTQYIIRRHSKKFQIDFVITDELNPNRGVRRFPG